MSHRLSSGVLTWLYIYRITQKMQRRLSAHLDQQHRLTPAQFNVLAQLQQTPGISQQQLTDRLFVTKGNIVGILNRMEHCGLVTRQPHPQDGRTHMLILTERGAELAARVVPEHEALVDACIGLIATEDQRILHDTLRRLNHALGAE